MPNARAYATRFRLEAVFCLQDLLTFIKKFKADFGHEAMVVLLHFPSKVVRIP